MNYFESHNEQYELNNKLIEATLRLFKCVPGFVKDSEPIYELDNELNISHGFYITKKAYENCPHIADPENLEVITSIYGYNLVALNRGFYKSFSSVKGATPEKLIANQIMHYFSTYGLEALGIRNSDIVYIPNEALELPEDAKPVKITIIDYISTDEIKERTIKLITSGAALSNYTIDNIIVIINALNLNSSINLDEVPNKELRIKLCELLRLLPANPVEFLRYVVYQKIKNNLLANNPTLLIKSPEVIWLIRESSTRVERYFLSYINNCGLSNLAEIFHRYKPLWLSFKTESRKMASIINKMRKLADKYHKPMIPKILDTITSNKNIDLKEFERELSKVTIFKKISLVNSILFRNSSPESITFFIRNGKAYTTEYDSDFKFNEQVLNMLMSSIVETIRPNVEGKRVYIPNNFTYTMPTSEKLFWGAIPYGSSYALPGKNVVLGVHWLNIKDHAGDEYRVDLDLHFQSSKYDAGWNNYISDENIINSAEEKIIFSGDMTDAPIKAGGATEAFFIGQNVVDDMAIVELNNYTRNFMSVPFKFIIDDVKKDRIDRNYLINSHTMSFCLPNEINDAEKFLGFLQSDSEGNKKFYFTSASISKDIVAKYNEHTDKMVKALTVSFESCLKLKDVLQKAGAVFEKPDDAEWDINLDPQMITKDTILNLMI